MSEVPIVDLPTREPITISGDLLTEAQGMDQVERDALLIWTFRNTQEIAGFCRELSKLFEMFSSSPMAGMIPGLIVPNGNGGPVLPPDFRN